MTAARRATARAAPRSRHRRRCHLRAGSSGPLRTRTDSPTRRAAFRRASARRVVPQRRTVRTPLGPHRKTDASAAMAPAASPLTELLLEPFRHDGMDERADVAAELRYLAN